MKERNFASASDIDCLIRLDEVENGESRMIQFARRFYKRLDFFEGLKVERTIVVRLGDRVRFNDRQPFSMSRTYEWA